MFEVFQWSETPFKWCWALYHVTKRGKTCIHLECRFDTKAAAMEDVSNFCGIVSTAKFKVRKTRVRLV